MIAFILFYKYGFKPYFKKQATCRFDPCCSSYALECYKSLSFLKATKLTILRLAKCHPFGSYGYDPLPSKKERIV